MQFTAICIASNDRIVQSISLEADVGEEDQKYIST